MPTAPSHAPNSQNGLPRTPARTSTGISFVERYTRTASEASTVAARHRSSGAAPTPSPSPKEAAGPGESATGCRASANTENSGRGTGSKARNLRRRCPLNTAATPQGGIAPHL
eukprot:12947033-Alexandrium_andersonii.AAC.1